MTVDFALFLSPDGIALAHRQQAGHWALVGEARMDGSDLDAQMSELRAAAEARAGSDFKTVLVLPDDQVLYTSFMAPADDAALTEERIADGLEGVTPYAVSDLSFVWRAVEADRVKVAVVARETLAEAEQFAEGFGFTAAGFAAMPPAERFPGMPVFGDAAADMALPADGMAFGADDWANPPEAAADAADPEPEAEPEARPTDEPDPVSAHDPAPERKAEAKPEVAPEAQPEVEPDAGPATPDEDRAADPADASDDASDDAPDDAAADEGPDPLPTPLADPTLDRPVTPIEADDGADVPDPADPAPSDASADDTTDDTADDTPPPGPVADRGKAAKKGGGSAIKADKGSSPKPPRAARITPGVAGGDASLPSGPPAEASGSDADGPALGFSARRGRAARPDAGTGQIVSTRPSRFGVGPTGDAASEPVLHPDAAPARAGDTAAPAGKPAARPPSRLAAQLTRVRDASKSRNRPVPEAPAAALPDDAAGDAMAARDDASAAEAAMPAAGDGGRFGRTGATAAPAAADPTAAATEDSPFTSGLLARKPVESGGPTFRTGLILTLLLLLLLGAIALWSVLFLPDGPVARFLTGGDADSTTAVNGPLDAPAPPAAFTAPPTIGNRDDGAGGAQRGDPGAADMAALEVAPDETPDAPDGAALPAEDTAEAPTPPPEAEELPDIDADLDLPPLPPLPEDLLPSVEETERIYAEDGIWPRTPDRPTIGALSTANDIYVASIDPDVPSLDAVALPDPQTDFNELLSRVPSPPPFGTDFDRDARGLIDPTPEGVLTPEGAFVIAGSPPFPTRPRPGEAAPAAAIDTPEIDVEDAILGTFRPTARPDDLGELRERQLLGGFSATELAQRRPATRPQSAQEAAAAASLFPQAEDGVEVDPEDGDVTQVAAVEIGGTALAVASSRMPNLRPANIAQIVASAQRAPVAPVAAVPANVVAAAPSIPSNASVSRAATETNAIRLHNLNLIGVTGTASDRRALVRLPSGRFVRVGVGDRLNGGRVAAISENSLQYVRRGRNVTLEIPG